MSKFANKITVIYFVLLVPFLGMFLARPVYAALSCSVTTSVACTGGTNKVILRMSGATNAHAELPGQADADYDANVVCCNGITGLDTLCSGTFATVLKLSAVTNAHAQQSGSYAQSACMSVPSGGTVSVGYQATNCTTPILYDTTLASMKATDNSHVGNTTAYTEYKICGTAAGAASQSLTFNISDPTIGFGALNSSARYATGDTLGSASDTADAHTLSASTNASSGYVITLNGATLASGGNTITAIGASAVASSPGAEQFGARLIVNSGTGGSATAPYASANWALDTAAFPDQVASGAGDSTEDVFGVRYIANIAGSTEAGSYTGTLTYVATATF